MPGVVLCTAMMAKAQQGLGWSPSTSQESNGNFSSLKQSIETNYVSSCHRLEEESTAPPILVCKSNEGPPHRVRCQQGPQQEG